MEQLSASIRERAASIAATIIKQEKASSVQYAVSYHGEIVLSGSKGKLDSQESHPLSATDLYGIGSVSKLYVTAAALILLQQGKLELDKPYQEYVPEFCMADPRYQKITVRHLMNHSSGIYGTHFRGSMLFEEVSTFPHDNLLTSLRESYLKFDPGSYSEYCNDGFQLLEILVERLSGLPYNQFLKQRLLEPMGLKHTATALDSFDRVRLARLCMPQHYSGDLPCEIVNVLGTGGIISTAEDMCRFGQLLLGKKILSPQTAQLMYDKNSAHASSFWQIDAQRDSSFGFGLGYDHINLPPFSELGIRALSKGGDTAQYHAALVLIPELELVAAVASAGASSSNDTLLAIALLKEACLAYGLVADFPPEPAIKPPVKQEMPTALHHFAGLYAERDKFRRIEIIDDEIELPALAGGLVPAQKYLYSGDDQFTSPDGKVSLSFLESPNGITFLQAEIVRIVPGVGQIIRKSFIYQKLTKHPLHADVLRAWQERNGRKYLMVDDLPASESLLQSPQTMAVEMSLDAEAGHAFGGARIYDAHTARNVLYARDVGDYRFNYIDGVEYLHHRGYTFMCVEAVRPLNDQVHTVTIATNGYTTYFTVAENLAGRTLRVTLPEGGTFAAYAKKMEKPKVDHDSKEAPPLEKKPLEANISTEPSTLLKVLTTVTGNQPITLADGDTLVFMGKPGTNFALEINGR